jgi:hypothetical protein
VVAGTSNHSRHEAQVASLQGRRCPHFICSPGSSSDDQGWANDTPRRVVQPRQAWHGCQQTDMSNPSLAEKASAQEFDFLNNCNYKTAGPPIYGS